jgi:hypothetical protein
MTGKFTAFFKQAQAKQNRENGTTETKDEPGRKFFGLWKAPRSSVKKALTDFSNRVGNGTNPECWELPDDLHWLEVNESLSSRPQTADSVYHNTKK